MNELMEKVTLPIWKIHFLVQSRSGVKPLLCGWGKQNKPHYRTKLHDLLLTSALLALEWHAHLPKAIIIHLNAKDHSKIVI